MDFMRKETAEDSVIYAKKRQSKKIIVDRLFYAVCILIGIVMTIYGCVGKLWYVIVVGILYTAFSIVFLIRYIKKRNDTFNEYRKKFKQKYNDCCNHHYELTDTGIVDYNMNDETFSKVEYQYIKKVFTDKEYINIVLNNGSYLYFERKLFNPDEEQTMLNIFRENNIEVKE